VFGCISQRLAVEGFLKGSSVVVCAPTSSGKTLIAECAAAALFAVQKRLFYTTPLKALSNQKFREFRYPEIPPGFSAILVCCC
jgi:superfamily II RNA helicase